MADHELAIANLLERIGHLNRADEQMGDLYPAQWAALRYLGRANKFSRTPVALTHYLGTTRGTMSQTIIALEKKGYVTRTPSERDKRSIDINLTDKGIAKLEEDPIHHLAEQIHKTIGHEEENLRRYLSNLLIQLIKENNGRAFGQCYTCRHFSKNKKSESEYQFYCNLLEENLTENESKKICAEQEQNI